MIRITNNEIKSSLKIPVLFRCLSLVLLWSAVIVVLISVLVLVGWLFEVDLLKRFIPGYVFMNPTTAAAFILSSIALWLMQSAGVRRIRLAQICTAVVLLVGLIKLFAVEIVENSKYDLILMNCQMPEMDEFDATANRPNRAD